MLAAALLLANAWLNHKSGIIHHFKGIEGQENEFASWAFGDGFWDMQAPDLMVAWNLKHGNELLLRPDSEITKDAPKMVALWNTTR